MTDRRERPWKKLRVIVEVTVPPNSRATERDLAFLVGEQMPRTFKLRRPTHANAHEAVVRVKSFTSFLPAFLRKEKGLSTGRKKSNDPNNGL